VKKGIVLEVHDEHVTILTPEGEFLKSRKQKGQVHLGEEIVFFPLHRAESAKKGRLALDLRGKWAIISVMTAIILAFTLYPRYTSNQVYAYVSVDVNPSIELGINKDMKVISMDAYNEDGESIIKQMKDWEKQDITSVSSQIFDIFRQKGFLTENSEVLIASVLSNDTNSGWKTLMQNKITTISEKVQQDKVSITTLETTIKERADALKEGMSPGKYIQKEQKTELVESEDTSKTEPAPTMPLNQKSPEIEHANAKEEKSGPPSFVEIKKNEKEADKKERKDWQKQHQTEKKEQQEDWQKEKIEHKQERKEQRDDWQQKGKQEREERKEHNKEERTERKQETGGKGNGKNKDDEEKKGSPPHAKPKDKPNHNESNKEKKNHDGKRGNDR